MEIIFSLLVGILFTAGIYLVLQRHILRLILGLSLFGHATHLMILTVSGFQSGSGPIIKAGKKVLEEPYPDPLPQALILTAIVISFAVTAFMLVLIYRANSVLDLEDIAHMTDEEASS